MTTRRDEQRRRYAVVWRAGDGPVRPGGLVLGTAGLQLETGAPDGRLSAQRLRYADLARVEKAPPSDRLHGRPTTLVHRRNCPPVAIAALDGPGFAHEIAERLVRAVTAASAA
jgi:hypothetical protein